MRLAAQKSSPVRPDLPGLMMPLFDRFRSVSVLAAALAGMLVTVLLSVSPSSAHPALTTPSVSDSTAQRADPIPDQPYAPEISAFVQTVLHTASGSSSTPEGFSVPRARLAAEGGAESIAYEVEADFADDVLLKDARIAYQPITQLTLGAGRFKVPFSYGELVSSARTDFVQRPRAARQLSIGRRTGVDATYRAWNERVKLQAGVFSGAPNADVSEDWLSAARLTWTATTRGVRSTIGVNAAYVQYAEETGHARLGVDVRLTRGRAFLTAEWLTAPDDLHAPAERGAYVTTGYALADAHLIRAQWDYISGRASTSPDTSSSSRSLIGLGYTLQLSAPLRVEIDYLVPPTAEASERSAVLVNVQVDL